MATRISAQSHIDLLGFEVKDKVTNYKGVIVSICFDLYGCVQAAVKPKELRDGMPQDGTWLDVKRLVKTSKSRVMEVPDFCQPEIGAETKPRHPPY